MRPLRTLPGIVVATLALALAGCSDGELTVTDAVVDDGSGATEEPAEPAEPDETAEPDPDLNDDPDTVGALSVRLPLGWAPLGSPGVATSTEESQIFGGALVTTVPAEGRDQAAWVSALRNGETDVVEKGEGLTEQSPVTTADGRELFHLVHDYADGRAQLFGFVEGDSLHLLRFGLDGTDESAAVAARAAATVTLAD